VLHAAQQSQVPPWAPQPLGFAEKHTQNDMVYKMTGFGYYADLLHHEEWLLALLATTRPTVLPWYFRKHFLISVHEISYATAGKRRKILLAFKRRLA
jgi:hypothetical protein